VDLDAENFLGRWALVEALAMPGRYEEALVAVEPALMMSGRHPWALSALAGIHAARGAYDAAHAVYHELTSRGKTGYIESASQAAAAAAAGRMEEALSLAAEGAERRETFLLYWRAFPDWAAFRSDERGEKLLLDFGP
jgi:hypothetical protein